MKKRLTVLLLLVCVALQTSGCAFLHDEAIPRGYLRAEEYFDPNATQDSVDYCKYFYGADGMKKIRVCGGYQEAEAADVRLLQGYFKDFRKWMEAGERMACYDFNEECINTGDLFFLRKKEGYPEYGYYSLYFFDCKSGILYYIHANI